MDSLLVSNNFLQSFNSFSLSATNYEHKNKDKTSPKHKNTQNEQNDKQNERNDKQNERKELL